MKLKREHDNLEVTYFLPAEEGFMSESRRIPLVPMHPGDPAVMCHTRWVRDLNSL